MGSACVYEEKTVIHELTQGLQMANQLRVNLHSPEVRDFLIQKILSSYENALFVLQSGHSAGQPPPPALPAPNLLESPISFGSPGSEEFKFDQPFSSHQGENIISKKRKGSQTWEHQVRVCRGKGLEGGNAVPSLTSFGLIEDHHHVHFPNQYSEELLHVYSPYSISPVTSESNLFTEWGSSPSMDFPAHLADVPLDFGIINSLF
ncbi:putative WRKY transcription factor, plant [Helianthus annuus]|nr:putative WRKY transcription factor, plant [Helianthus annuus]KAJ0730487.1 putative WRKY transcription factor, plant [Helianthus annuus]